MFLTTHAAAGIAIGRYVDNPWAVFWLAFASHLVLDFIPHGDENLYGEYKIPGIPRRFRKALIVNTVDLILLVLLIVWAVGQPSQFEGRLMLIGILGSLLPDLLSHVFPILHERLSWLFLVRWLYSLSKPTGVRYVVRGQDWLHAVLHHHIIRRDIPLGVGIFLQVVLIGVLLMSIWVPTLDVLPPVQ